ncbi:MAG: hypothetical protein H7335_20545 [Massilia sp.]|nr:hypothetical protein [Massilia sp.]
MAVSVFLCLLSVSVKAHDKADDAIGFPAWTFGAYGTFGAAYSSERHADYTASVLTPGEAGYTHRISPAVDSRIGAQLGVSFDSRWSAMVQIVSERNLLNSYRPAVGWANIKYQMTPDFSVRLGRISLPIFLAGDYHKAGYALAWVRAPVEVYGGLPVSISDGIDASLRWHALGINHVTQAFFGNANVKIDEHDGHVRGRHVTGLSNTATYGALSMRASALTADLSIDLAHPLFDAFRQFGPQGAALADTYDTVHKRSSIASLGLSYDPGNWFLLSEVSRLNTRSFLGAKSAAYATVGVRFGNFAPYLTVAKVKSDGPTRDPGLNLALLPPAAAPAAAYLNGQLNGLLSTIPIQQTVSAGVRWDFSPNRAFKVQYDRLLPQGGSSGTLINVQPGFASGHAVHVLSAVLDVVF